MSRIRTSLLLAAPWGALGCSDHGLHATLGGPPSEEVAPVIEVVPDTLTFDALLAGQVETREVTVRNVGPDHSVLEVSDLGFEGVDSYTLVEDPGDFRLPGGQEKTLRVSFSPIQPWDHDATLWVESDDPVVPHLPVALRGEGLVPELAIEPDPLDLGARDVGCEVTGRVTLTNVGSFDLEVEQVTQAGEGFSLEGPPFPLVLDAGEAVDLDVVFAPTREGAHEAVLAVESTERAGERTARQTGVGIARPEVWDQFAVPTTGAADILFFVDQSNSISDDRSALSENFAAFIDRLSLASPDWRIMVVNGDDGCTNSGILTPETDNFVGVFERAVSSGGGVWTEAGLYVSALALEQAGPGACNEGFGRDDALVHVIVVSDEPDQSPGTWDTYVSRMRATRADGSLLRISAVAGDLPDGCETARNSASAGTGYLEAATATGGLFLSICSPWSDNVDALADVRVTLDVIRLSQPADPATIEIAVDGEPVPSGWAYDPGSQSIVFSIGSLPSEGSIIDVRYSPPVDCG